MTHSIPSAYNTPEEDQTFSRKRQAEDRHLMDKVLEIYDQKQVAEKLRALGDADWTRESLNRWINGKIEQKPLTHVETEILKGLIPSPPKHHGHYDFKFIDLFAGIGGIRKGFEDIGGQCVFTSEWNEQAVRTYKANWYCGETAHKFNSDIREITMPDNGNRDFVYAHIDKEIPDHDVLLAGFPCQPFSLAGVSKKNSLGRAHGFECEAQGTLFFDVARIIDAKRPTAFVLENVKNLKSHDKGNTFRVIKEALTELGYWVSDLDVNGSSDPKIIDGKHFIPQHRERIVLVGFRKDLNLHEGFTLKDVATLFPENRITFADLLEPVEKLDSKYILTPKLWSYLYQYAKKHKAKGNGFGYGLVDPKNPATVARTLSARYHKDGSEILIDRGWDMTLAETDFNNENNQQNRPRRLAPRECARLMGFEQPGEYKFRIPVSDTQAYRQFGNSVVVPVFAAVAKLMKPYIMKTTAK
ncbi:DNA (cytosine-5-)-methyltransferase [Aeromonas sobria]|uniref:Cytosine-specific methyltransferase n=1 Tax=Aeromonas sobria TaxID=646 RepID=A0A2N3IV96_AERSO|nr:DNA cytosine methyltransferase [Aeromonas sobria]PKQ76157.1 DNA (cytosine-5-)-methyltransferase [Aeromonas sobria]